MRVSLHVFQNPTSALKGLWGTSYGNAFEGSMSYTEDLVTLDRNKFYLLIQDSHFLNSEDPDLLS